MIIFNYYLRLAKNKFKNVFVRSDHNFSQQYELRMRGYSQETIKETIAIADSLGLRNKYYNSETIDPVWFGVNKLFLTFQHLQELGLPYSDFYKLNEYGLRSDEFKPSHLHKETHVLFSGCSVTTGEAMFLEHSWANILHRKISEKQKTSGYFNVAVPGFSIMSSIDQIFRYIKLSGNPDYIFLLLPPAIRDEKNRDEKNNQLPKVSQKTIEDITNKCNYLVDYCKKNEIKLFASSWDLYHEHDMDSIVDFQRHSRIDPEEMSEYVYNFCEKNRDHEFKNFLVTALDVEHPGIALHNYYADFFYNKLLEDGYENSGD